MQELALRNVTLPGVLAPFKTLEGTEHAHRHDLSFCDVLHDGKDCNTHFVSIIPSLIKRSLSVYVPVYIASTVAVHRAALLANPLPILS